MAHGGEGALLGRGTVTLDSSPWQGSLAIKRGILEMTRSVILQFIKEMESKLTELRAAVEKLPEAIRRRPADTLADLEQEEIKKEEVNDLNMIFAVLRVAWNVPPDVEPDMTLEELQKAMAEGLPENWASREIMRMREE